MYLFGAREDSVKCCELYGKCSLGDCIGNRGRQRLQQFFMPGQLTLAALRALGSSLVSALKLYLLLSHCSALLPSLEAAAVDPFSYQELPKTRKEKPQR